MSSPYNTRGFHAENLGEILRRQHINPDYIRWEPHRAWGEKAKFASGKRRAILKRCHQPDEDTRLAMFPEGWDASNQRWNVSQGFLLTVPEIPALLVVTSATCDLVKRGYVAKRLIDEDKCHVRLKQRSPETDFFPLR